MVNTNLYNHGSCLHFYSRMAILIAVVNTFTQVFDRNLRLLSVFSGWRRSRRTVTARTRSVEDRLIRVCAVLPKRLRISLYQPWGRQIHAPSSSSRKRTSYANMPSSLLNGDILFTHKKCTAVVIQYLSLRDASHRSFHRIPAFHTPVFSPNTPSHPYSFKQENTYNVYIANIAMGR